MRLVFEKKKIFTQFIEKSNMLYRDKTLIRLDINEILYYHYKIITHGDNDILCVETET